MELSVKVIDFQEWSDRVRENKRAEAQRRAQQEEAQRRQETEQWQRLLLQEFRL